MGLLVKLFLTAAIVITVVSIFTMIFAAATDFKYEWLNKMIDCIFAVCVPVLFVMLGLALFAGAGILLYAIWCM